MKTKTQKQIEGAREQIRNIEQINTKAQASGQSGTDKKDNRLPIDLAKRQANRQLPTDKLIALLRTEAPKFFEVAEVVGKWVWIQFTEKQPRDITARLAEFGFHWNNQRQAWQHPCGTFRKQPFNGDPRERYGSQFPADRQAA